MSGRDNYKCHFDAHDLDKQASLVDQRKWRLDKFEDGNLGLVSKFTVGNNKEKIETLEIDYESIDSYKVSEKPLVKANT
jgi:hypothetical protein